jgi:CRISPR/Cas system-associated exonuclease Cas4 (RecB family)
MDEYISASEVGEYLFCERAWWMRQHGIETSKPEVLEQGTIEHEVLAEQVQQVERGSRFGQRLLWVGLALLILFVLLRLLMG